jgi:endonuclease/exonuclease/phosphatase family metal-dependent hydrolase
MKKISLFILIIFFIKCYSIGQTIKVITYNLRYDNPLDGENNWKFRKGKIVEMVKFYEPDFFCIQEGLADQVDFLDSALLYKHIGAGRDDGYRKGEFAAIYYNFNKFKLMKYSNFWLSETPDVVSRGWDAVCIRICTYGLFKDIISNKYFWVFNTHLDHVGDSARINSAKLILNKISTLNSDNFPVILTGDFNLAPESEPIRYISSIMSDSRLSEPPVIFGPDGTFNDFKFNAPANQRIDYIFISKKGLKTEKYATFNHSFNCRSPSDHFPVFAEIRFINK